MADWSAPLPDEAVEGADTHVEDHNRLIDAISEVRTNVDNIELTPGPTGDSPEITWDGTKIVVDGETGPDLKGAPGEDGDEGAPSQEEWDALVARVDALEGTTED